MSARRRRSLMALVGLGALVAAGCGSGATVTTTPSGPPATPATTGPAAGGPATAGRGPDRIVVVVEENHAFDQIVGAAQAPFVAHLAATGTLLTSYFAITHPSLPNYLAMVSGDTQGITSDCSDCTVDASNIVDQLERARITWKAYMEGLPAPCSDARQAGGYAKKHNPFMYFASIRDDPARCRKVVPAGQLDADLAAGRLPRFAFVTPELGHDMHGDRKDGGGALIRAADDWLRTLYAKLTGSPAWTPGTRLVVTWDEAGGGDHASCCGGLGAGGHIPTIVAGPGVHAGRDGATYDHYALLRSIEAAFHLPFLGHAGDPSSATIPALAGRGPP